MKNRQRSTRSEGHSRQTGPSGRSAPVRTLDRHRDLRPSRRETARGAHVRPDRPSLRSARRTRRRGHPGVRRTRSAARRRPLGAGVTRTAAAVPTTVLSGGIAFDGNGFVGTAVTAPAFSYLRPIEVGMKGLVAQISQMEPTDQLDATNRRLPESRVRWLNADRHLGRHRRFSSQILAPQSLPRSSDLAVLLRPRKPCLGSWHGQVRRLLDRPYEVVFIQRSRVSAIASRSRARAETHMRIVSLTPRARTSRERKGCEGSHQTAPKPCVRHSGS